MKHFRALKLFNTDFKYIINQNHSPHFLALEQSKACFFTNPLKTKQLYARLLCPAAELVLHPCHNLADLARVLPPLRDWSGRGGFELQFGRRRCVVQRVRHPQQVVMGSDVDPPHRCVRP